MFSAVYRGDEDAFYRAVIINSPSGYAAASQRFGLAAQRLHAAIRSRDIRGEPRTRTRMGSKSFAVAKRSGSSVWVTATRRVRGRPLDRKWGSGFAARRP